jgi:hypothetical protein
MFYHLRLMCFNDFLDWNEFVGDKTMLIDVLFGAYPSRFYYYQMKRK